MSVNPFGTDLPLVAAPMSGGATTPELIRASLLAGAFAFLPGGYKPAAQLATDIHKLKAAGLEFGVNLFKAEPTPISADRYAARAAELQGEADVHELVLADVPMRNDDDEWGAKLASVLADPVPWLSTTFGAPSVEEVRALHDAGVRVAITVTRVDEARQAERLGADLLVLQAARAGGHSATWDPARDIWDSGTPADLVREIAGQTRLPLIAGGRLADAHAVAATIAAGAEAAVIGTHLLRSHESGAPQAHKDALTDPRFDRTVITRAFTGRPARGLLNHFIREHEAGAPLGYPAIHHLTSGLRKAAASAGDPDRLHLWAGTGYRSARAAPAGEILRDLAASITSADVNTSK